MVKNNEDTICAFLSIDDSSKEIIPRFVCYNVMNRCGIDSFAGLTFTINHFSTPLLYKNESYYQTLLNERTIAFKEIGGWINDGRLIILDSEDGRSFDFLASTLRALREKNPSKRIVFFLDNLHLLSADSWSESGHDKIKKISHEIKALCVSTNSTIISTVELRKIAKGQKADNNDLAGSASLAYDSNAIAILHSELDIDPSSDKFFKHGYHIKKNPIIETNISKNKIGSFKGLLYAKLYASQAYYEFITESRYNYLFGSNEAEEYANKFDSQR